ncbi:MAG TPA: GDP-mannose 4,6-dehydratase [Acidimicrobiia bacterium]|nr:GDP-mannose 4,6-dehydratase [Acidimicrobiia bacterium]
MTTKGIVTGGAGFIGSHLVELLVDREWEVLVIDDLSSGSIDNLAAARRRGIANIHVTGVTDPELADVVARFSPEVIFHLAAQSKVRPSVEDPMHDARVNVVGTLNVLEAARRAGVRKVCFASSGGAIYGGDVKLPAKESAAKAPQSPYGISKKIVEDYFHWYSQVHGVAYTLLALANVYGPRQDPGLEGGVTAIFSLAMLEGRRPKIFGDGTQTRDFVYVEDVCDAFLRAADRGDGHLLNIGSGIETSVNDLYGLVADVTDYPTKPDYAPAKPGDVYRSVVDPSRAKKELGWEPWTSLREGLEKTVEWYRGRAG